jgi:DNA-binding GntR family transcriptional regulator
MLDHRKYQQEEWASRVFSAILSALRSIMTAVFQQLPNPTLRGRIAESLRHAILTGTLREGERIVERKLAAQFSTSLTAVREALIELESEGFVYKKPNSATYVTKVSRESADRIFAVRRLLESYAVEEAARQATPERVKRLEMLYLDLLDAARAKDTQLFIRTDYLLHETMWLLSGNDYLHAALRRLVLPVFAATAIRIFARRPFDLVQDAQLHLPLIHAISNGNPAEARSALEHAMDEWLTQFRWYLTSGDEDHQD